MDINLSKKATVLIPVKELVTLYDVVKFKKDQQDAL